MIEDLARLNDSNGRRGLVVARIGARAAYPLLMERSAWTDERLDDLARRMDAGFARVDADIRELRAEIGGLRRTLLRMGGAS